MKAREIEVGGRYLAKVSGQMRVVRVDRIHTNYDGRSRYEVTNLATGRRTTFRSPAKFRGPAAAEHPLLGSYPLGTQYPVSPRW